MRNNYLVSFMFENLTKDEAKRLNDVLIKFAESHSTYCGGAIYPVDDEGNVIKESKDGKQGEES